MPALSSADDAAVRTLARQILDRPEYAPWRSRPSFDWIIGWLVRLFDENPALFWVIVAAMVLLLVLIVVHVAWTIRRGLTARPADVRDGAHDGRRSFVDDATALARDGRFLDASRAVQLGVIQLLVGAGRIELGRGDANRVLRRRLGQAHIDGALRDELVASIASLERRWFRDREEDEELYRRWRWVYGRLTAEIGDP
jgi:hypothetical protein